MEVSVSFLLGLIVLPLFIVTLVMAIRGWRKAKSKIELIMLPIITGVEAANLFLNISVIVDYVILNTCILFLVYMLYKTSKIAAKVAVGNEK